MIRKVEGTGRTLFYSIIVSFLSHAACPSQTTQPNLTFPNSIGLLTIQSTGIICCYISPTLTLITLHLSTESKGMRDFRLPPRSR